MQIFSTKNIGIFEILTFEILTKRYLTMSLVLNNRPQLGKTFLAVHHAIFSVNFIVAAGTCNVV